MGRHSLPPTTHGIWQFKTTADLADSTSGTLVGLNDLRTLGVPYDGQNSAVAVVDTGVDANSPPFRGRVAPGTDIFTGGLGNDDLAASGGGTAAGGRLGAAGGAAVPAGGPCWRIRSTDTALPSPESSRSSSLRPPSFQSTSFCLQRRL